MSNQSYNPTYMVIIILFSSAIVALGIQQNLALYHRGPGVSTHEVRSMISQLHGDLSAARILQKRRERHREASSVRNEEYQSVVRFLKSFIP